MKMGPDTARLAHLMGDPARSNMLEALIDGRALTASELASAAGIGASTASAHLAKLEDAGLVTNVKQGRHRYYSLANEQVGNLLENLMSLADHLGHMRVRTGPREPALRQARVCYNHLAGEMGVALYDSMVRRKLLHLAAHDLELTAKGRNFITRFGIEVASLEHPGRPLCRTCLDWSARRYHLAGSLGRALLAKMEELKWLRRDKENRVLHVTQAGKARFEELLSG
jgi:DNA-binding transcriptional ArsR family regulator